MKDYNCGFCDYNEFELLDYKDRQVRKCLRCGWTNKNEIDKNWWKLSNHSR